MTALSDQEIDAIARRIVQDLQDGGAPAPAAPPGPAIASGLGIFTTVDDAVAAARAAAPVFVALPLAVREGIIAAMRKAGLDNAEALARSAHAETGLGRVEDKIVKNRLVSEKTPGTEDLYPVARSSSPDTTPANPAMAAW